MSCQVCRIHSAHLYPSSGAVSSTWAKPTLAEVPVLNSNTETPQEKCLNIYLFLNGKIFFSFAFIQVQACMEKCFKSSSWSTNQEHKCSYMLSFMFLLLTFFIITHQTWFLSNNSMWIHSGFKCSYQQSQSNETNLFAKAEGSLNLIMALTPSLSWLL